MPLALKKGLLAAAAKLDEENGEQASASELHLLRAEAEAGRQSTLRQLAVHQAELGATSEALGVTRSKDEAELKGWLEESGRQAKQGEVDHCEALDAQVGRGLWGLGGGLVG